MHLLQLNVTLLKTALGSEYPALTFQTFNNIAHSFNVQGDVN